VESCRRTSRKAADTSGTSHYSPESVGEVERGRGEACKKGGERERNSLKRPRILLRNGYGGDVPHDSTTAVNVCIELT
jgi:hypothetical protein